MENYITAKHSFNSGDLLTCLPGLQKLYQETGRKVLIYQRLDLPANYGHNDSHPIKDATGRMVCMNESMFYMLKPLIETQDYIYGFEIWQGQKVDFDFDLTRQNAQMPLPAGSIHHWCSLIFPQLECDLSAPWLSVPEMNHIAWAIEMAHIAPSLSLEDVLKIYDMTGLMMYKSPARQQIIPFGCKGRIIINRTNRYQNPYIDFNFLKNYQDLLVFAGTTEEYDTFCNKWGLNYIPYLKIDNFLELGQALSVCKFFIGNQSMAWHMADAMKVPRILEVCSSYPNTFPTGANGHSFITQGALEYQFNKLIKGINE